MYFFMRVKKKMRISKIKVIIPSFVMSIFMLSGISSMDFSNNKDTKLVLRGTEIGMWLPNWLTTGLVLIFGLVLLAISIYSFVSLIKDKDFNQFMDTVREYGEVEYIGNLLSNIPESRYVKRGELRINNKIFFYLHNGNAKIYPTIYITSVQPKKVKKNDREKYFVDIGFNNEIIEIETQKKQLPLLMEEITSALKTQIK